MRATAAITLNGNITNQSVSYVGIEVLGQLKKDTHANVDFDVVLEGGTEDGDPSPEKKVQRQDEEDVRAVGCVVPVRQQYHSFIFKHFHFLLCSLRWTCQFQNI